MFHFRQTQRRQLTASKWILLFRTHRKSRFDLPLILQIFMSTCTQNIKKLKFLIFLRMRYVLINELFQELFFNSHFAACYVDQIIVYFPVCEKKVCLNGRVQKS